MGPECRGRSVIFNPELLLNGLRGAPLLGQNLFAIYPAPVSDLPSKLHARTWTSNAVLPIPRPSIQLKRQTYLRGVLEPIELQMLASSICRPFQPLVVLGMRSYW